MVPNRWGTYDDDYRADPTGSLFCTILIRIGHGETEYVLVKICIFEN